MSDFHDAQRGQFAQSVLDNPVYADSYALIEREVMNLWRDSRDPAEREELHRFLKAMTKARNVLETTMRTGKLAMAELERKRTLSERLGLKRNAA
jgi:hypothetical protein